MARYIAIPGESQLQLYEGGIELEELQTAVRGKGWGGYIEPVYLDGMLMLVNEDAIVQFQPVNDLASHLAGAKIFGPALIFTGEDQSVLQ